MACAEYDRRMETYIVAVKAYSAVMSQTKARSGVDFELVRLRVDETRQICEEARHAVEEHQSQHG